MRSLLFLLAAFVLGAQTSAAQQCDYGIVFDEPITITTGGTYSGNWESKNRTVPAVTIATSQPVTIINSRIKGPGHGIATAQFQSTHTIRLTAKNNCFIGVNPNVKGVYKGSGIRIFKGGNILVENNDFLNVGEYGVLIFWNGSDTPGSETVRIRYNRFENIDGRASDGAGGWSTTPPDIYPHAINLLDVHNVAGAEIAWNQVINRPYESFVIDSISVTDTQGTAASPLLIHDNYVQGGYQPYVKNPSNYTGTGILVDGFSNTKPEDATRYVRMYNNQVVSVSGGGVCICIGNNIEMYNNRVVTSGQLADGTNISQSATGGILHFNWRGDPPGVFGNNSVYNNVSGQRRLRNGVWERSDYFFGVTPTTAFNNTNFQPNNATAPTLADEADELVLWRQKLTTANITLGSSLVNNPGAAGSCDLNGDGSVNVVDVQLSTNQALGTTACGTADISQDGSCNVIDVQRFVNAALGLGCQLG